MSSPTQGARGWNALPSLNLLRVYDRRGSPSPFLVFRFADDKAFSSSTGTQHSSSWALLRSRTLGISFDLATRVLAFNNSQGFADSFGDADTDHVDERPRDLIP
ncbi:uncharacterized protein N7496_001270 [Penicillium cataractarum]|uniref:Uncharacterized protein n=1 Tax=Penicillium cataractarum TaxID=2100454 RepID=A0A9X0B6X4_9EURO|nr:uncharacterized protein N7496_001270 [Penicillium cataractarum]KAJ5390202.1 hypothetical protein N7496_001270 [Penicillium cataractarum]